MLTQVQIAAKRHERTMKSRAKKAGKRTAHGRLLAENAIRREKTLSWLANLGAEHQKAESAAEYRRRQALESRRTKAAMAKQAPKGLVGRIKSFFGRRS